MANVILKNIYTKSMYWRDIDNHNLPHFSDLFWSWRGELRPQDVFDELEAWAEDSGYNPSHTFRVRTCLLGHKMHDPSSAEINEFCEKQDFPGEK